jgi:hypothetical protein
MCWGGIVILALVAGIAAVIQTTGLRRAFLARKAEVAVVPRVAQRLLTEAGIAHFPTSVQRYSEGEAIWHLPEGPFTYGRMRLTGYEAK